MATAVIEHHPENGRAAHVVVIKGQTTGPIWFAYETRERAESKRPELEKRATAAGL